MFPTRWFGLAAALLGAQPQSLHAQALSPADSVAIGSLRQRFVARYNAGDPSGLEDLYTRDAVRLPYDAPAVTGQAAVVESLRRTFRGRATMPTLALTALELRRAGDWAFERGTYHEIIRLRSGSSLVEDGKYVAVLRRGADGSWRYHWSIFNRDRPATPVGHG